ncbi:MAG: L,D-transpeptidase [Terrimicrobiaceae bacterium]|nr:L,D-transpeptidase [Terrimicrobiaceae bacterium]
MKTSVAFARVTLAIIVAGGFSSCTVFDGIKARQAQRAEEKRFSELRAEALSAHSTWRESTRSWKSKTYRNDALLSQATPENVSIEIALSEQRGLLLVHGAVAMDFPVATGKRSHPTPAGSYTILEKKKDYASNLYGKIIGADGTVLDSDADTRTDVVPDGATFSAAKMPYWMRLTNTGVGLHVGYVPGRPASHGCIRLRRETAIKLFELTRLGTPVVIASKAPSLAAGETKPGT